MMGGGVFSAPWWPGVRAAAIAEPPGLDGRPGPAARAREAWRDAELGRRRIVDILRESRIEVSSDVDLGDKIDRSQVDAVRTPAGVVVTRGRLIRSDWLADPERLAEKMCTCSSTWRVMRRGRRFVAAPYRCHSPLCPVDGRIKAMRSAATWESVIEEIRAAGFEVGHLTHTIPHHQWDQGHPTLLTEGERAVYAAPLPFRQEDGDEWGYSTPGEGLLEMYNRFRGVWHAVRNDRGSRRWWRDSVLATLTGIEWTSFGVRDGMRIPRWHVHAHTLIVFRRGMAPAWVDGRARDDRGWLRDFVWHWTARGGGSVCELRQVDTPRAVHEVLKYPFKVGQMTRAQLVECLAATKGLRPHQCGGAFHGNSKIATAAREIAAGCSSTLAELAPDAQDAARALSARYLPDLDDEAAAVFFRPDGVEPVPKVLLWRDLRDLPESAELELFEYRGEVEVRSVAGSQLVCPVLEPIGTWFVGELRADLAEPPQRAPPDG